MKKIVFSEISNLITDKEVNMAAMQFITSIYCEYLISYCKYGANGNDFYPLIKKKYCTSESSNPDFLGKILKLEEMFGFLQNFPTFNATGKFLNKSDLNNFLNLSSITIDGEFNIFTFGSNEYKWKRLFVNIVEKDNVTYGCYYSNRGEESYWIKCGAFTKMCEAPKVDFEQLNPEGNILIKETKLRTISEEQFFNSPESPEDIRKLDKEQKKAVSVPLDKNSLILAGAGSGKTRCLVSRLAYLNLVKGIPLNRIVLLTFTNNVAIEMAKRAVELMNPVYAEFYPGEEPQVDARTIDSFFVRIVRRFYKEIGFKSEAEPILKISTKTYDSTIEEYKANVVLNIIENNGLEGIFSYYLNRDDDAARSKGARVLVRKIENYLIGMPVNTSGLSNLTSLYLEWQINHGEVLGFESITFLIKNALEDPTNDLKSKIENLYDCILIDEFQDISKLQNDAFSTFYGGKINFTFCGDDDQTIYGFRGSDNSIIKNISLRKDVETVSLNTNYRSDPAIVEASNCILKRIIGRTKTNPMKSALQTESKIIVSNYSEDYTEIITEIDSLIKGGVNPNDILILTRSDKILDRNSGKAINVTDILYNALTAANIKVLKPQIVFELNDDFVTFISIIRIILGKDVISSIFDLRKSAFGTDDVGVTDYFIEQIVLGKEEPLDDSPTLADIYKKAELIRCSEDKNFSDLLEKYTKTFVNDGESEVVFKEFRRLAIDDNVPWKVTGYRFNELVKHFNSIFRDTSSRSKSKESSGVRINTIHKAKGLQASIVFIIGLEAGKMPNTEQIDSEYKAAKRELDIIKKSREKYQKLKSEMKREKITVALESCKMGEFDEKEQTYVDGFLSEFDDDFIDGIMVLDSFALDQYRELFNTHFGTLDFRYDRFIGECQNSYLAKKEQFDMLEGQRKLALANNVDFPEDQDKKIVDLALELRKLNEKIKRAKVRRAAFLEYTKGARDLFKTSNLALGYLADMYRENDIEKLENELEVKRQNQINEERRVFYVAVTRAEKALYLMNLSGTNESDFVKMLPDKLLERKRLLTKSEQQDLRNCVDEARKKIEKVKDKNEDDISVNDVEIRVESEQIKSLFKSFVDGVFKENPKLQNLTGEAKQFLIIGLQYDCIAKRSGLPSELPISTCFERSILHLLQDRIGEDAVAYRTGDEQTINKIISLVRNGMKKCKSNMPGRAYIHDLFSTSSRDNATKTLKGIAIMNYFFRNNNMGIHGLVEYKWMNPCVNNKGNLSEELLVNCIDLSNCRNEIIHEDPTSWPKNILVEIFKYYMNIVDLIY